MPAQRGGGSRDGNERDRLPIPDYDHLPLGSITHRIRSLDADGLRRLMEYEKRHGDRAPVMQIFTARLEALNSGGQPSGGSPQAATPEAAGAPTGGSRVSPATEGPKINPPSQGVPTNPAQPRSTG